MHSSHARACALCVCEIQLLPYNASLDHYLDPATLDTSPYAHRERSFLTNRNTPVELLRASAVRVRVCEGVDASAAAAAGDAACSQPSSAFLAGFSGGGETRLQPKPSISALRAALGGTSARLLVFDDVLASFGGWGGGEAEAAEAIRYHEDAQSLLSTWCCTDDARFKRLVGVIPYILPPLEGQSAWKGHARLGWASAALAEIFEQSNETALASLVRWPVASEGDTKGR